MSGDRCALCFAPVSAGASCADCVGNEPVSSGVLLPGAVLQEKYLLGHLLGRGGFGATYLGWDLNLQVRVAIKEFLPRQLAARDANSTFVYPFSGTSNEFSAGLEQFLNEARTLAKFRDEAGIIPVLDFFSSNGTAYMVLQYEAGITLEQYLASSGPLAPATALQLLMPIADALRVCHAVGLIHRDIAPDNIFLTHDRRVKLFDFGASRFALNPDGTNLSVILKEGFAPFEQYQRNGRQGAWTDVYALTATLYRLLTGQLPPSAPDRLGGTPLPALADYDVTAPASLEMLIERGMALAPESRFQNVDEFLEAALPALAELNGAAREAKPTQDHAKEPVRPQPIPRKSATARGLVFGGGAAAALAIAAVVFVLVRPIHSVPSSSGGAASIALSTTPASAATAMPSPLPATQSPQDQVSSQLPNPQPSNGNMVDLAKANLRQAMQDQLVLQKNMVRRNAAQTALQQMGPSSGANDPTAGARQMEQSQIDSANQEIGDVLPRYEEDLQMLAGVQHSAVTAAMQTERTDIQATAIDASSTAQAQVVTKVIAVIQNEMSGAANNTLTAGQIASDLK